MNKKRALELCRQSPILLGKICLPTAFPYRPADFHHEITDAFLHEKKREKIVIIAPRGHAKSTVVGLVWVLYHIFFEPGPKFIVLVSKTLDHATRMLTSIKDVLDYNMRLRALFGYYGLHSMIKCTSTEVILKDGTYILCRGTGQMIVGLKHLSQRPTLIVLDDPEDMNNTKTIEAMEYNLRWFLQQLVPTRDPKRSRVIVIGTPQHQRCLVETLMDMDGWTKFRYSSLMDNETRALWPDGPWPLEKLLEEKRSLQSIGRISSFLREYQCQIVSDENSPIREEYIKYHTGIHEQILGYNYLKIGDELKPVNIFIGVDPATSVSENADYTVIMPIAIDKERNIYVLPYIKKRMYPSETIETIRRMNRSLKPRGVYLEATAAQETFRDVLRRMENEYIPGLNLKLLPKERKDKRYLDVLEPYFFKRKIYLGSGMSDLVGQLLSFGRGSKHDDLLDGLYWSLHRVYPPVHELVKEIKGYTDDDMQIKYADNYMTV